METVCKREFQSSEEEPRIIHSPYGVSFKVFEQASHEAYSHPLMIQAVYSTGHDRSLQTVDCSPALIYESHHR